jgi:hypothetical protein
MQQQLEQSFHVLQETERQQTDEDGIISLSSLSKNIFNNQMQPDPDREFEETKLA